MGPAGLGIELRVGRNRGVPGPRPAHPRLHRGLDTVLCCGHKMAPRAGGLRFAPLGSSVLCACTLVSRPPEILASVAGVRGPRPRRSTSLLPTPPPRPGLLGRLRCLFLRSRLLRSAGGFACRRLYGTLPRAVSLQDAAAPLAQRLPRAGRCARPQAGE